MKPLPTRIRILHAAEEAFADKGFDGVSLREITRRAKVNLAAVNYHFRTKENLYAEVLRHRIRPINEARLARLDAALARPADQAPSLEEILEILIRPVFEVHRDPAAGGPCIVRIIGRSLTEPLPFMGRLMAEEFHPVLARFSQAIRRHAGHLTPEDFLWRLSFVVGAMHHTLATLHQIGVLTRGICRNNDHEGALARFLTTAAAVFTAPARRVA